MKFKKPAVYVSANLPKMEELADTETRPLDLFESDALSQLQKGEDLVPHATTNRIRMLGSLRADKQCLECHDVKRGHRLMHFPTNHSGNGWTIGNGMSPRNIGPYSEWNG